MTPSTPYGRGTSLITFMIGVFMLAANHYGAVVYGEQHQIGLWLGPIVLVMGLGGLIDPRILWSFHRDSGPFPAWIRRVRLVLILLAIALILVLELVVYPRDRWR